MSETFSANPFVYEGKTVEITAKFIEMLTSTQGVFDAGGELFVVSNIPKGSFASKGIEILLAGRVIGEEVLLYLI